MSSVELKTIWRGSRGPLVRRWQYFLRGRDFYHSEVDGRFGLLTEKATRKFQWLSSLHQDGIVGNQTWGAAMAEGLQILPPIETTGKFGPHWPPRPNDVRPLTAAERDKQFGHIAYRAAPTERNPERIVITNGWRKNLTRVVVPELRSVYGAPQSGRVTVHKDVAGPLKELFAAWRQAGLDSLILSWAGLWCARFVRGSRSRLSNHSYGSAFDINATWNLLGCTPALVGELGSVRKLVPIANELGWWCGLHGWPPHYDRLDGMHFERGMRR